jgi:hypothetical protein
MNAVRIACSLDQGRLAVAGSAADGHAAGNRFVARGTAGRSSRREGAAMKAIAHHRFGLPDGLALRDFDRPALTDDGVLVRVRASSVNPAEWSR